MDFFRWSTSLTWAGLVEIRGVRRPVAHHARSELFTSCPFIHELRRRVVRRTGRCVLYLPVLGHLDEFLPVVEEEGEGPKYYDE